MQDLESAPSSHESPALTSASSRRGLLRWLKWGLLLIVLGCVLWQGVTLGRKLDWNELRLSPGWLALSGVCYLLGWLPCVWFWRKLVLQQGVRLPWLTAIRAHYCGQWGKYVPGKAAVLLIRGSMVQARGLPLLRGVLTAGYESLASMAVGGGVAVALAPWIVPRAELSRLGGDFLAPDRWGALVPFGVCLLGIGLFSVVSHLIQRVMTGTIRRLGSDPGPVATDVHPPLWAIFALVLTWWLHGLSLGCTIQAMGVGSFVWEAWPRWTAAVSLGTVAGFVVLLSPGGLGVREGMMMLALEPSLGAGAALVPVVLRLIWFVSEALAAVACYWLIPAASPDPQSCSPSSSPS